jgi:hypothetical protein
MSVDEGVCLWMKETKLDPYKLDLLFVERCALSVLEYTGGGFGQSRDGTLTDPCAACCCLGMPLESGLLGRYSDWSSG